MENENIHHVSLCSVHGKDSKSNTWLIHRIADYSEIEGEFVQFKANESFDKKFENRELLFLRDEPSFDDVVIIEWNAVPNKRNEQSDYVTCKEKFSIDPLEIIELKQASDIDDVIKILKDGIMSPQWDTFLVCSNGALHQRDFSCVLCNKHDFSRNGDLLQINSNVWKCDLYHISEFDVLKIENIERCFYKKLKPKDDPYTTQLIRSELEIIQECMIQAFPWSVGKNSGISKAEWSRIKDILKNLSSENLIENIASKFQCSTNTAKNKLYDYLHNIDTMIDPSSVAEDVYIDIINNSKLISQKCAEVWAKNHEDECRLIIENIQKQTYDRIGEYDRRLALKEAEVIRIQNEIDDKAAELNQLQLKLNELTQKEQLVEDIERKISERIAAAQKSASDFIAEMAFQFQPTAMTPTAPRLMITEYTRHDEGWVEIRDIQDAFDNIHDNLQNIGIDQRYRDSLAILLIAAWYIKQPLLLAGPKGKLIVDAFSMSLFAKRSAELNCVGSVDSNIFNAIQNCQSEVVTIHHAIQSQWTDFLPEILAIKNKFILIDHPFIEDLPIEPKSLYNYVLPVFTEYLLDVDQENVFEAGVMTQSLNIKLYCDSVPNILWLKKSGIVGLYGQNIIAKLIKLCISIAKIVCVKFSVDDIALLTYMPFAYATGQLDKVSDSFQALKLTEDAQKLIHSFYGDFE